MTPADIAAALFRTTLATSAAALAAWALLAWLRIDAPRIHRLAWLLVIAQGWLFFPLTIEIETAPPLPTKRAAGLVPAVIHEAETLPFENEAEWGRGPFATSASPLVEAPPSQKVLDPFPLAITTWLLGAIALAVIAIGRYWRVLRTLPLGSPADEPTWQAEWHAARAAAQLRRRQAVDLRVTASLGPLLHWAPWVYLVLVPRELWAALASPERQAILRHELAHLRRYDLWKSLAIRVLALPQW
jgi:beta-lactamase regulating signal transducer with metallopeptidase domain